MYLGHREGAGIALFVAWELLKRRGSHTEMRLAKFQVGERWPRASASGRAECPKVTRDRRCHQVPSQEWPWGKEVETEEAPASKIFPHSKIKVFSLG